MIVLLVAGFGRAHWVSAQSGLTVLEHEETIVFGEMIRFWAKFQSEETIEKVEVLYRPVDGLRTLQGEAEVDGDEVVYIHLVSANPGAIPVFSTVEYRFLVTLENGETITTDKYYFEYMDNRFNWQTLTDPPFRAHWIEGDTAFGQTILDAARAGLLKAQTLVDVSAPEDLDIYVYPRAADLQRALELSGFVLAAGHASPELNVVMVSLPAGPAQRLEIQRQIPHEIMHILLYNRLGNRQDNLPVWLDEGLASMVEVTSNPEYYIMLENAVSNDALLSMESLCRGFRLEASLFYLSYAQSESFTRYLYDNYGTSGMEALLDVYADGVECTRGPEIALGQSLSRLEERWQRTLVGEVDIGKELAPLIPWIVLLLSVLGAPVILAIGGIVGKRNPVGVGVKAR
jgi:hypothetical protein